MDIKAALSALEALSSSPSTSSSGPLNALLEDHFAQARQRIAAGEDPKAVITDLQKNVVKAKKEVDKGLRKWYAGLGSVGTAVDKNFPPNLPGISDAYTNPELFSQNEAPAALDKVVLASLGRQGLWEAVDAFEEETGLKYDPELRKASEEMHQIVNAIRSGDVQPALQWCEANAEYLASPPHPSPLPYHLHRSVFIRLQNPSEAIQYARRHLMPYVPTQPVLQLITSCLYPTPPSSDKDADGDVDMIANGGTNGNSNTIGDGSDEMDIDDEGRPGVFKSPYKHEAVPLIKMFKEEFCRRHGWPKEEPLEVLVDLGSRGGALNAIEKARRIMGEQLGPVRTWTDLPAEIPVPSSRRYHSVFVCPVSKCQATKSNPPQMLSCGHVLAKDSLQRLYKGGRRSVKCPYCPVETSVQAVQQLFF